MAINPIEGALALAKAIPEFQKEQRVSPFMQALQNLSSKWGAAGTDTERQSLNAAANQTRQNFLQAGGSPLELDSKLWGSDPTQGFQTGGEDYTPGYAADNMTTGQREKLAALTGLFAGRPTYNKQVTDAGLTGLFNGLPTMQKQELDASMTGLFNGEKTWPRQYQEQTMAANTAAKLASANKTSASDIKAANLADAQNEIWKDLHEGMPLEQVEANIVKNAGKYASGGLNYDDLIDYAWIAKTGSKKPGKSSSTKSSSTDEVQATLDRANGNPQ